MAPSLNAKPRHSAMFVVTASHCPQILCRVLGLIAQQGRMIDRVDAILTKRTLRVTLCVPDLDHHRAAIIAEKMRQLVQVRSVRLDGGLPKDESKRYREF